MSLPEPATHAAGRLVLLYTQGPIQHRMSANILTEQNVNVPAGMSAEAHSWATVVAPVLGDDCTITGWEVTSSDGDYLYSQEFSPVYPGTSPQASPSFRSATITLIGRATAAPIGYRRGGCRLEMFVGKGMYNVPGTFGLNTADIPGLHNLSLYLDNSEVIWADKYGQKASCKPRATTQYNAHAQRVLGT